MYNKLFTKILDSSIWLEDNPTRLIWITLIAAMDENGFVQFASIKNLAHRAIVKEDEAFKAVERLESPDPDSSDPENEGRRVEKVPGGWIVINAEKYRAIVTREESKRLNRERVAKHREKSKNVMKCNDLVIGSNDPVMQSEAYTEAYTNTISLSSEDEAPRDVILSKNFLLFWESYPKKTGRLASWKTWKKMRLDSKIDTLLSALELQKKSSKWTEEGGRFVPNPLTWLNQGRWDDEVRVEKTQKEKIREALLS